MMASVHGLLRRKQLLSERQSDLLERLRVLLEQLLMALERFGADTRPEDVRTLRDLLANLNELFLIVIAGEFNSGKSSFVNALLGAPILPEGVTPTTDAITLLRYGDEKTSELQQPGLRTTTYPADVLRQLVIVDTPGTNAVIREHEELTRKFIPRADLVLFTTSADRPFTESERAFLALIKEWGKKIVLVLNKIDILEAAELDQVLTFVRENARDLLGVTPEIFPVSARQALRSRSAGNDGGRLWDVSRFAAVESYIVDTLDEETRVKLKLLSPLGVGSHIVGQYLAATETRLETLREDFITIDNIEQQLNLFRDDLNNDVQYHINEIDLVLRDLRQRGDAFFDENIRLGRIGDLVRSEELKARFEEEVIGDVNRQIEQKVNELVDWMVAKDLRLWQSTVDYINRRRVGSHSEHMIGIVGGAFDYNRGALMETVGHSVTQIVATYDKQAESQHLADEVRASLAATAITQAGAVGLGALLLTLFHTALLDVTGILAATLVAVGGFALLPAKRRQAKREFNSKVDELNAQIQSSVQRQFEREVEQSLGRVREAIAPYTRFVRAQRGQFTELQQNFSDIDVALERLRAEIEEK
jgi:small GTP-binding protein